MALLDDIAAAQLTISGRLGDALDSKKLATRYTYDNIGQAADGSAGWKGQWAAADRERIDQLNLLQQAISDPSWTANLDRELAARKESQEAQIDSGYRSAEDQRKMAAARSGTAAGANDAAVEAENRQRVAAAKAQVSQQVDELRAAGIQNLDEMGRQLLAQALAGPEETAAMGVANAGRQAGLQTSQQIAANNDQYRGLLAGTISGFMQNLTPTIQMGFQGADRWNDAQRQNYTDARDTGAYSGSYNDWVANNGGAGSFWNW